MVLLLAVFALAATIYSTFPRDRRLELRLRFGALGWLMVIAAFAFALYVEFFDYLHTVGLAPAKTAFPTGITPEKLLYVAFLVLLILLTIYLRAAPLMRSQIDKVRDLALELLWSKRYAELISVIESNLKRFFKIYKNDFFLPRLKKRLDPPFWKRVQIAGQRRQGRLEKILEQLKIGFASLLPSFEKSQASARELARSVFLSRPFCTAVVQSRPYLGVEVLSHWGKGHDADDFVFLYLTELLAFPQSVFYSEIKNNQNISVAGRYMIPPSNKLLSFLFSDAQAANELAVWRPVGEYVIKYLDDLARDPKTDPYNLATDDFNKAGAWDSPVFVTIRFFDIMVSEALHQGVTWHMWLYYFPHFAERIVRNHTIDDPLADPGSEWPIRYSYLLYEMFSAMRNWITSIEHLPLDQENVQLESTAATHENGNIPKSAILALGECVRIVLESEKLLPKFRHYLLDIVFNIYFDLRRDQRLEYYATAFRATLVQGGHHSRSNDAQYRTRLCESFQHHRREYVIKRENAHVTELENQICGAR